MAGPSGSGGELQPISIEQARRYYDDADSAHDFDHELSELICQLRQIAFLQCTQVRRGIDGRKNVLPRRLTDRFLLFCFHYRFTSKMYFFDINNFVLRSILIKKLD